MLFRNKNTKEFVSLEDFSRQAWLYNAEIRSRANKAGKGLFDYVYLNPLECAQLMDYDYYEEVYVKLCDNVFDERYERFSDRCLKDMKDMFIGKKIKICDDEYGLIDSVELVHEKPTKYIYLKAKVLLPVNDKTKAIVNQIKEGTIKKVFISLSIKSRRCSICGCEPNECEHIPGRNYRGELCLINLYDPLEIYDCEFTLDSDKINSNKKDENMTCYKDGGCGPYEDLSCTECPASKPEYLNNLPPTSVPNKPIRDWTLQECKDWCEKQNGCPEHCPLEDLCAAFKDEPQVWRLDDHFVFTEDEIEKAEAIKTLFPNAKAIVKFDTGTVTVVGIDLTFSSDYFPTIPNGVTCDIDEIING